MIDLVPIVTLPLFLDEISLHDPPQTLVQGDLLQVFFVFVLLDVPQQTLLEDLLLSLLFIQRRVLSRLLRVELRKLMVDLLIDLVETLEVDLHVLEVDQEILGDFLESNRFQNFRHFLLQLLVSISQGFLRILVALLDHHALFLDHLLDSALLMGQFFIGLQLLLVLLLDLRPGLLLGVRVLIELLVLEVVNQLEVVIFNVVQESLYFCHGVGRLLLLLYVGEEHLLLLQLTLPGGKPLFEVLVIEDLFIQLVDLINEVFVPQIALLLVLHLLRVVFQLVNLVLEGLEVLLALVLGRLHLLQLLFLLGDLQLQRVELELDLVRVLFEELEVSVDLLLLRKDLLLELLDLVLLVLDPQFGEDYLFLVRNEVLFAHSFFLNELDLLLGLSKVRLDQLLLEKIQLPLEMELLILDHLLLELVDLPVSLLVF